MMGQESLRVTPVKLVSRIPILLPPRRGRGCPKICSCKHW